MIEKKTTKEIVEDFIKEFDIYIMKDRTVAYPLVTDEKGLEQINRIWVNWESLKKEIEHKKENYCYRLFDYSEGYYDALIFVLDLLCKSQEQRETKEADIRCHKGSKTLLPSSDTSVSCEHNTGEDMMRGSEKTNSKSSPVQNPKIQILKKSHWINELIKLDVKKKCTCRQKFLPDKDDKKCLRCGGEL